MTTTDAEKLKEVYTVLHRLVNWEQMMGGWEAPVWSDARKLDAELSKQYREKTL